MTTKLLSVDQEGLNSNDWSRGDKWASPRRSNRLNVMGVLGRDMKGQVGEWGRGGECKRRQLEFGDILEVMRELSSMETSWNMKVTLNRSPRNEGNRISTAHLLSPD